MDRMQPVHPSHAPAPASLAPTAPLHPSANLSSTVAQPNPFTTASQQAAQALAAPLQTTSACALQPTMPQTQPFSQALNHADQAAAIPVAPQRNNSESIPRSEAAPGTQPAADLYPHQVEGLGGPTATAPFLQDFNLVAEAAKRAQMSVVMRDLESVTL